MLHFTSYTELSLTSLAAAFLTLWAAMMGACLGSFLNVVVWRLPQKLPILSGRSFCPKCKTPIRSQDNIPVFGWLRLKGKCRSCVQPISARYPLVEATTGAIFALAFITQVLAHGFTLPPWFDEHYGGWFIEIPRCEWLLLALKHSLLMYYLLGLALFEWDRHQVPVRYFCFSAAVPFLFTLVSPAFMPSDWILTVSQPPDKMSLLDSLLRNSLGLIMGMLLGLLISVRSFRLNSWSQPGVVAFALIGCYVGWQGVLSVAVIASAVHLTVRGMVPRGRAVDKRSREVPFIAATLLISTAGLFGSWRWLNEIPYWPGTSHDPLIILAQISLSVVNAIFVIRCNASNGHNSRASTFDVGHASSEVPNHE